MTQRVKHRIDTLGVKAKSYNHGKGAENYNKVNDFVFSSDINTWLRSKARRFAGKENKDLF